MYIYLYMIYMYIDVCDVNIPTHIYLCVCVCVCVTNVLYIAQLVKYMTCKHENPNLHSQDLASTLKPCFGESKMG